MHITSNYDPFALRQNGSKPLIANWDAGAFDIKAGSFTIGAYTLNGTEFAFLDGQDQNVKIASSPTFVDLTLTSLNLLPTGIILLWYGSVASIPSGFALCDGSNGTPDLRNRFIIAAGSTYAPGATGGTEQHTHPGECAETTTDLASGTDVEQGTGLSMTSDLHGHTVFIDSILLLPPYYALCYIMKL